MMWSTRSPPECRSAFATSSRNGANSSAARRSGRHGGCCQSWPVCAYGSGGAPTVIPRASSSWYDHESAPIGLTPDREVVDDPQPQPGAAGRGLRVGELVVELPLHPAVEVHAVRVCRGELGDLGGRGVLQRGRPVVPVRTVHLDERAPGGEPLERCTLADAEGAIRERAAGVARLRVQQPQRQRASPSTRRRGRSGPGRSAARTALPSCSIAARTSAPQRRRTPGCVRRAGTADSRTAGWSAGTATASSARPAPPRAAD